jgi:two-component system, OmpR family, sensor histidine kinase VicK
MSSSADTHSKAIERTVVLTNPEDMIKISLRIFEQLSESMDAICDNKGVQVTINTKPIWDGMHVLKSRGVKLRWITDITEENLDWCKEFMKIVEIRHLDKIEGAFGIHDGKYYLASANVTRGRQNISGRINRKQRWGHRSTTAANIFSFMG